MYIPVRRRGEDAAPTGYFARLGYRLHQHVYREMFYTVGMKYFKDPVLAGLAGLLALTVTLFLTGVLPYPFGILILLVLIMARLLFNQ